MLQAQAFIDAAGERGLRLYSGVPCSYLKPLINGVINAPQLRYVGAANEGDAVALASGAMLGGLGSIVMLQNSGLGNAVSPLTSLNQIARIPLLLIITWRGQPGGKPDEPQHQLMGAITPDLLALQQIPWSPFPTEHAQLAPTLDRALAHMAEHQSPYALLLADAGIAPQPLEGHLASRPHTLAQLPAPQAASVTRQAMLAALRSAAQPSDLLLATTGYTGRELYALGDADNQFYQVGAMGCVSSVGLGLAIAQPTRRVIVIDGDGAALMRLGAWSTIGYERPPNLLHVLLDNQVHESTGGQSTVAASLDFCAIAAACGYQRVLRLTQPEALAGLLAAPNQALTFVHVPIRPGVAQNLPRPTITPAAVAQRLRRLLAEGESCEQSC